MSTLNLNQTSASLVGLRVSPRKLNLVCATIRNLHVSQAVVQLSFSQKRIANSVKKCLLSAVANAENNHNLDIDNLYVSSVLVGKNMVMKRFRPRARGRGAKILKFFSNLRIVLTEINESK